MINDFFDNNDSFRYLKSYYSLPDSAERYGVSRMEIKHSNFLAWILKPENNGNLGTSTIKNLLKIIQSHSTLANKFNVLDLDKVVLSDIVIKRESVYNIDLFISMKINGEPYAFIIENKINAIIHDDQLGRYRDDILNDPKYVNYNIFCVYLYTSYQDAEYINNQLSKVRNAGYTPITYQDIYDNVLLPITKYSTSSEQIYIISDYIHCLASYTSDAGNEIMIITDRDKESLSNLFKEDKMLTFVDEVRNIKKSNEYIDFYNQNKALFLMIFNKYRILAKNNSNIIAKLDSIITGKKYLMNNTSFRGIAELLKEMISILVNEKHYTFANLDNILNELYPDPLIVPVTEVQNVKHPKWFTTYKKTIKIENTEYYILSAWGYDDYADLKEKINSLDIGITLE